MKYIVHVSKIWLFCRTFQKLCSKVRSFLTKLFSYRKFASKPVYNYSCNDNTVKCKPRYKIMFPNGVERLDTMPSGIVVVGVIAGVTTAVLCLIVAGGIIAIVVYKR